MTCSVVTGGAGFVGSHLVEYLIELGHRVIVIDNLATGKIENLAHIKNEYLHFVKKDVCDIADFEPPCELDYVFHLAGRADIVPSITHPEEYFHSNVDGTFKMLQWARAKNAKKFVYAASSSCYGIPEQYPTPENAPLDCQYPYALTKKMGEDLVMHWGKVYKLPVVSLRLFNVYGLRSRTTGAYGAVMGVFLAQIANEKPVTVVGDGTQSRDFVHVRDVARAFVMSAEFKDDGMIFNVGSGKPHTINELVALLKAPVVEYIPDRPSEPKVTWADIRTAKSVLGWQPQIPFTEGVWQLKTNINLYKNAPVWTKDTIADATAEWFRRLS